MESKTKLNEWIDTIKDKLEEQVWFQELKTKWEELDPQSRTYLRFASFGGSILLIFLIILSSIWRVHSLKKELSDKRALLGIIQNANDEIRQIKDTLPSGATAGLDKELPPWQNYFESVAASSGVDKSILTVSSEKPGPSSDQSKEALFELGLKHVNIKQVIKYAFSLENGQRPVKLRNILIDTKSDPSGYMDATLAVSAFTPVVAK